MTPDTLAVVVVTYHRFSSLAEVLASLESQTVAPKRILVVDNSTESLQVERTATVCERFQHLDLEHIRTGDNLGPAGALRLAVDLLQDDEGCSAVMFVDDDDPFTSPDQIERLLGVFEHATTFDPACAGVGITGANLDRRTGRLRRVRISKTDALVSVDYIGGGQFPIYDIEALASVDAPDPSLFFGFDDLDLGLRLQASGRTLYVDARWLAGRRANMPPRSSRTMFVEAVGWRDYYSSRNIIVIFRRYGLLGGAVFLSVVRLGRALASGLRYPRSTFSQVRFLLRGLAHGWLGRSGRIVQP